MKKYAVIVAGGSGSRMVADKPKQFLLLQGKPVIWHSIHAFLTAFTDITILLVLPKNSLHEGELLRNEFPENASIQLTEGGNTRFQSVQNGLKLVMEPSIVFVHDGVRCLVSRDLIHRCYEQACAKGSAIPAVMATDSIRMVEDEEHHVVNRNQVRIIQTPQTFQSQILLAAFEQPMEDGFTDEATVVEANGDTVFLLEGDYDNIKLTRPIDLVIAEKILSERSISQ